MSDQTKADLDAALAAHIADVGDGSFVTDWAMIAALTTVDNIGTGRTSYFLEGNENQPVHVMTGLFRYASERVIWDDDDDDD